MKEMMKRTSEDFRGKAKSGSPAARLMGKGTMHRDMGGSTNGADMGTNTGSSIARSPGADSNFRKGGSTFKDMKNSMKRCFANGGAVMDTMHGTPVSTGNKDILNTFHGNSSTGAISRAAGGIGKKRKGYPMT